MPFYSGGGGGFRSIRRYGRRRRSYRARRFKRVSRKMVASALETKYHPDPDINGGAYRFGINTTGNLCEDGNNTGAAYFCPFAFESAGGTLRPFSAGDGRLSNVIGNKIWVKSVRMVCHFDNLDASIHTCRMTVFQFHDWASCSPTGTGDTHFSKSIVPFGHTYDALATPVPLSVIGLMPSLKAAGRFTILHDISFSLDANSATTVNSSKIVEVRLNRGFKHLIEFDPSGFTVMRNPIIACFYSDFDNDATAATCPTVSIQSRVSYKDV